MDFHPFTISSQLLVLLNRSCFQIQVALEGVGYQRDKAEGNACNMCGLLLLVWFWHILIADLIP